MTTKMLMRTGTLMQHLELSYRQVDYDEQTGFLETTPAGFADRGALPKLAWSNR